MSPHPVRRMVTPAAVALLGLAASAAPAAAAKPYSPLDEQSVMTSIEGDRFEVAGGRLAQAHGSTPQVRALGARLARDHGRSLREGARLARRLGISVPKQPSPTETWELGVVGAARGATFDRLYTTLEIQDHRQDIMDAMEELDGGQNVAVLAKTRSDLRMYRTHLKLTKRVHASLARAGTPPFTG